MPQLFERRDFLGNSPAVWILAAILFAIPLGSWSLSHLERRDDVALWLPPSDPTRQAMEWTAESFPIPQDLLVTWTGSSLNDSRVAALRQQLQPTPDENGVLRGGLPHITSVSDPRGLLQQMLDHEVPAAEAVQRLTGLGLGRGPLCVRLTDDGRKKLRRIQADLPVEARKKWGVELQVALAGNAASMAPTETTEPALVEPVYTGTDGTLREETAPAHDLELSWNGLADALLIEWLNEFHPDGTTAETSLIQDLFYIPGSPIALEITFSDAGRADRAETLQRIRDAAVAVGIPLADFKIVGPAVIEEDLYTATQQAGWNPAFPWQKVHRRSALLTSILAGVLMTILVLRDLRLIVITLVTSAGCVFATMALMPVAGADYSAFLFVTPVLIGALSLAGAIHIARRWQSSSALDDAGAVVDASRKTMPSGFAITGMAVVAVLVWCVSTLSPLRDWSEATSVALIASLFIVYFGMPSLLLLWRGRTVALADDPAMWQAIGSLWTTRPWVQAAGVFVLLIAASSGLRQASPQTSLARALPTKSSTHQAMATIESQLAGTIGVESLIRFDARAQDEHDAIARMELVRDIETKLRSHPAVSGCLSWADFYPATAPLDAEASRLETTRRAKLAQSLLDHWRDGGEQHAAAAKFYAVAKNDRDAEIDGDRGYSRRGDELWRISTRVRGTNAADLAQTQAELDGLIQGVLKAAPGTRHRLTGPLAIQVHTEQVALRTFLIAAGATIGLIWLTMIVSLRHLGAAFLALLPCVTPSTAVLGIWSLLGGRFDLAAMISAVVSVGLAAGQVLPMLLVFRKELSTGKSRPAAMMSMLGETGPVAWRSAWIMGLMLLPLATCEAAIVGQFCLLLPAMIGTGVVLQLMWLPQLLAGPLGLCFPTAPLVRSETSLDIAPTDNISANIAA